MPTTKVESHDMYWRPLKEVSGSGFPLQLGDFGGVAVSPWESVRLQCRLTAPSPIPFTLLDCHEKLCQLTVTVTIIEFSIHL